MTILEIDKAMYDIVMEKYNDCQRRLNAVPMENKRERKALIIEREMYGLCNRAGLLWYAWGTREACLIKRCGVIGQILQRYPRLNEVFTRLDEEERMIFIAALQAEIFMRDQFVRSYCAELKKAEAAKDLESSFELQIKIGACENVFKAWEKWRMEKDLYAGMFSEGLS